ncbi:peptidoglycan DD-metalloendopeptidase family protein [bacterium]|nr:peptidoglycan DD-metalloendopeptidase family protein [bacterium]
MFIYSAHRSARKTAGAPGMNRQGYAGEKESLRGQSGWGMGRRLRKIKWGLATLLVLGAVLAVSQVQRLSFASPPPLDESLLVQREVLTSFRSVPLSDPDEYEPDSMDRIEEVVEEVKTPATALTKNEFRLKKYKIKPGDNPWDLAQKHGIRAVTLMWANAAVMSDPKYLRPGKEILIPNMDVIEVKLKTGETLWSVGRRFSVGAPDILTFNQLKSGKDLKAGATVYVPNPNLTLQTVQRLARRNPDGLLWPASYRSVNSGFGFRVHPIKKRRIFHEGIDIGGGRGATVFSAADGQVSFVGWMRGYGKIIVIRHKNGLTTRYAHLSSTRVSRGQRVEQGQSIGAIGATGLATGPNLHFEVRKNGLPQDPLPYLRMR